MTYIGKTKNDSSIAIRKAWNGSHKIFLRGLFMGIVFDKDLEGVVLRLMHDERAKIYE